MDNFGWIFKGKIKQNLIDSGLLGVLLALTTHKISQEHICSFMGDDLQ